MTEKKSGVSKEIEQLLSEADEDVQRVIAAVTKIEGAFLYQRHRNEKALAKQIADAVRKEIQ